MMLNTIVRLTPTEWEILEHRLGLFDTLAIVMAETYGWNEQETENTARALHAVLEKGREFNPSMLTEVEVELLKDCVDGSTIFADMQAEESHSRYMNYMRARHSIEKKFEACGMAVYFPD